MQRNWLVALILATVGSAPAFAADMPVKARPLPPPVFTWTGCYLGVHAGAGTLFDVGAVDQSGQVDADRHGVGPLGGGQLGCNYQTGMLVLGIEAEGFASGIGNTVDDFRGDTLFGTTRIKNKWDVDVAARFGVAFDRILVYGKAGWVWGHFTWDSQNNNGGLQNAEATLDGLLIGLGVEYAFAANWTTKFEYDYLGFRAKDVTFTTNDPFVYNRSVSFEKHLFKIGLNYKFGDPTPASAVLSARNAMAAVPGSVTPYSWTGCYIGAQAGAGVTFAAGADDLGSGRHGVGGLAGGQVGCNFQTGMLVLGIEGDGVWSGMSATHTFFNGTRAISSITDKNLWDFDIAARFGVAFDRVLVYGKAGWAWGRFSFDFQDPPSFSSSGAKTLDGLLMGMGVEYAFLPNWTTKFEYDYIGFNAKGVRFVENSGFSSMESVSAAKHLFKVGVNYKFGGDGAFGSARNAFAAYMPVKAAPSVPFTWTGCYVGAHVGGGVLFDAGFVANQLNDRHGTGALGGGQAGCNYQAGMLVVGIEGEGAWSNIHNTTDTFLNNGTVIGTAHVNNKWDVDVAGRFGVAVDRALVYGKAGWAVGRFTWDLSNVNGGVENAAATLNGLLVGLGIEYAFLGNWTTKFEYDYIGFNAKNVQFTGDFGGGPFTFTQNVSADKHLVKFGLNYKFGPVVP